MSYLKHPITPRFCLFCKKKIERPQRAGYSYKIGWGCYQKMKFCSNLCKGKWQSIKFIGKNNPHWLGGHSKCIDCGKLLSIRYKKETRCKKCWSNFYIGKNNWRWKGGRLKSKCKICGKTTGDKYSLLCNQCNVGENHQGWKGDKVGYGALHFWVKKNLGQPVKCEHCGNTSLDINQYHWANKSGQYLRNLSDWIRLCRLCHKKYDKNIKYKRLTG